MAIWMIEDIEQDNYLLQSLLKREAKGASTLIKIPRSYRFSADGAEYSQFNKEAIPVGSIGTIEKLQKNGMKNVWLDSRFNVFKGAGYGYLLKDLMVNNYIPLTMEQISNAHQYLSEFSDYRSVFVRPDSYRKLFDGQTVCFKFMDEFIKNCDLPDDTDVLIAERQNLVQEWRVVIGKEPITASEYRRDGKLYIVSGAPGEVFDLAKEVRVRMPEDIKFFVADICRTEDGELKLLEINSFNTSGFYACDPDKIIDAVELWQTEWWAR